MGKLKKTLKKQGFTLVELIIVIAIIAVLAVSAFMILTKWLGKSRDSRKLADIETTSKSLMVWMNDLDNPQGTVPVPDNEVDVMFDGTHIFTQGVVGEGVVESVPSLQKAPKNPTNGSYYTYSRTTDGRKYQIATELEDGRKARAFANNVFAETRVNAIRGNFDPGIYTFLTGSDQIRVMYLPSIVSAGVISGDDIKDNQNFVLDGDGENLIESEGNKKPYHEVIGANEPLDVLFEGSLYELTKESTLTEMANKLNGMVALTGGVVTSQEVSSLLSVGGTNVAELSKKMSGTVPICAEGYTYDNDRNKCEIVPSCSAGYSYNATTKLCQKTITAIPTTSAPTVCSGKYTGRNRWGELAGNGNSCTAAPSGSCSYHAGSARFKLTFNSACVLERWSRDNNWTGYHNIAVGSSKHVTGSYELSVTVYNTSAGTTTCPSGYSLSGMTCYNTLTESPVCPNEGVFNESVNLCQLNATY